MSKKRKPTPLLKKVGLWLLAYLITVVANTIVCGYICQFYSWNKTIDLLAGGDTYNYATVTSAMITADITIPAAAIVLFIIYLL